jgi:hypothetical protein
MRLNSLCLSTPFFALTINSQYTVGQSYSTNVNYIEILSGRQNLSGIHMYNSDLGNENEDHSTMIYPDNPIRGVRYNERNVNLISTSITDELILTVDD